MRYLRFVCLAGFAMAQQKQASTYTYDIHGRRVEASRTATVRGADGSATVESGTTINGRMAPKERVEERILREDSTGRLVERVVKRYDQNGSPLAAEKVRIEERRNADGSIQVATTVYRGDINGRFALAEKVVSETSRSGDVERTNTTVERPSINGSLEVTEKSSGATTKTATGSRQDVVTYRRTDGRFSEAARRVTERVEKGTEVTETSHLYDSAVTGRMELTGQTVSHSSTAADGTAVTEVSVYGTNTPGWTGGGGQPHLREQQIIERKSGPGASTVETFSIRRPSPNNPNQLGAAQKISETVCDGCSLQRKP